MQWLSFLILVGILIIHGLWPNQFVIDKYSMGFIGLLAIPLLFPFLKKAKWFGAEFEFKEEIRKTKILVEKSEEQAKASQTYPEKPSIYLKTFKIATAKQLLYVDPNLSLASIRIEIERVLSKGITIFMDNSSKKPRTLREHIKWYLNHNVISEFQADALITISNMCNKAVHGADVTIEEAEEIMELTERLNNSFAVGYSINFEQNIDFENNGLVCEWEHCVEYFPLAEKRNDLSCPVFGHDCPGGIESRAKCNKSIEDIEPNRFIKDS